MNNRCSAVAGTFYPENPDELDSMVDDFINNAENNIPGEDIKGIISPHAGFIYSGSVAGYGYRLLQKLPDKEWDIFMLGPAHRAYIDISIGNYQTYKTPLGTIQVNNDICNALINKFQFNFIPEAHEDEHCLEVQLPFLQKCLKRFKIIPILCGQTEINILVEALDKYFHQENSLFIFSSDLSHFLPEDTAATIDHKSITRIIEMDFKRENEIDACGANPIKIAMRLAKRNGYNIKLLCHKDSSEVSGDQSSVVGYASFAIYK